MKNSGSLKTPLRYPGGKSRAVNYLGTLLPERISAYREPFIGGGSMALFITKNYPWVPVWINDSYYPLVAFWKTLKDQGSRMALDLLKIKASTYNSIDDQKKMFDEARQLIITGDEYTVGICFFILNKCSFSGLTESSSFSKQAYDGNFTINNIKNLVHYQKIIKSWKITCTDYSNVLKANWGAHDLQGDFIFLDPPYDIKANLYGRKGEQHKGFSHDKFAEDIKKLRTNFMITNNSNQTITDLFDTFTLMEWDLKYTMRSTGTYMKDQKERKELLITNYPNDRVIGM